jgi:hypothetical protein
MRSYQIEDTVPQKDVGVMVLASRIAAATLLRHKHSNEANGKDSDDDELLTAICKEWEESEELWDIYSTEMHSEDDVDTKTWGTGGGCLHTSGHITCPSTYDMDGRTYIIHVSNINWDFTVHPCHYNQKEDDGAPWLGEPALFSVQID